MRAKYRIALAFLSIAVLAGCRSNTKISVIQGPGISNTSLMVSMDEICKGKVEGFVGDELFVSSKNGVSLEFYKVGAASRDKQKIFTQPYNQSYKVIISRDSKYLMYDNYLINLDDKNITLLHGVDNSIAKNKLKISDVQDYSFYGNHEVILTNPFLYLKKYFGWNIYGMESYSGGSTTTKSIKFVEPSADKNFDFNNIKAPDINEISHAVLDIDNLKYVFLGFDSKTNENNLYVLDIYKKKFILIDSRVNGYALSPEGNEIAYVKSIEDDLSQDRLVISDMEGNEKREISSKLKISELSWSNDSNWIAFSGGERNESDIFIVNRSGAKEEQLTQDINSEGKIFWSANGKLAFSAKNNENIDENRAYLVCLNTGAANNNSPLPVDKDKERLVQELIKTLRWETDEYIKSNTKEE
ncbi:MAG: hypothetical protein Q8942_11495 [Bacillota bacterium]|nr:hypothetical protein [Bacillota bacterium]